MRFAIHFDSATLDTATTLYHATLDLVAFDIVELKTFMDAFEHLQATTITFKVITHSDYSIWSDATLRVGLHKKAVEDQQEEGVVVPYFSMEVSKMGLPQLDKYDLYNFFEEIAGPWDVLATPKLRMLELILIQTEHQTRWKKKPLGQFSGDRPTLVGRNVFDKLCNYIFNPVDVQVKMYTDPEREEYGLDLYCDCPF